MPRSFKRSRYVGRTAYRSSFVPTHARLAMRVVESQRRRQQAKYRQLASMGMRSCEYVA